MKMLEHTIDRLNRANLSFGLREAIIMSVAGIVIAGTAAYYYVR